jgi:hypothetical protein
MPMRGSHIHKKEYMYSHDRTMNLNNRQYMSLLTSGTFKSWSDHLWEP